MQIETSEDKNENNFCPEIFDQGWYLWQNPDVAAAEVDPWTHYLTAGWRENRKPNEFFFSAWYSAVYGDLGELDPLSHYEMIGSIEDRKPNPYFDPKWYKASYPEVCSSGRNPFEHFLNEGSAEYRYPNKFFNSHWYINTYREVKSQKMSPLSHYINQGIAKGYKPNPYFDPSWYKNKYFWELNASGCEAFEHFISSGVFINYHSSELCEIVSLYSDKYSNSNIIPSEESEDFREEAIKCCVKYIIENIMSGKPYVVFFAGSNTPKSDNMGGLFERVCTIDSRFGSWGRLYIQIGDDKSKSQFIYKETDNVYNIRISDNSIELDIAKIICLRARAVYSHSIYNISDAKSRFFYMQNKNNIIDLHGAIPEELEVEGYFKKSRNANEVER
ncbi:hypothetical protein LC593_36850, partial [Nostoc sp. CHAB 5844]|nr:hypothetical protein [Nostoc sp. CHAB 5844]